MPPSASALERLLASRLDDPFSALGLFAEPDGYCLRVYRPHAERIALQTPQGEAELLPSGQAGVFEWRGTSPPKRPWRLRAHEAGETIEFVDPYAFAEPLLSEETLYLFNQGRLLQAWRSLGAWPMTTEGVSGVRFAVWAPAAERVSVIGPFNRWDGRVHPMRRRGNTGVWELFIPGLETGALYKFEIRHRESGALRIKTDPFARRFEPRPGTAAVVCGESAHIWHDAAWMQARAQRDWLYTAMNVYELHPGSWQRRADGSFLNWTELAQTLIPYVLNMGYTHIELMPVTEHPLDESWGYQTTGYFAPTNRYGTADELRAFIDACHGAGLGVLLDWVPGHFPMDDWALARFDGSALFEHEDPRLGVHQDWGTHIFNYGRAEVRGFLLASAYYWLSEFHFDGLRVDAVASMLYLDYSRKPGEWLPNRYGGRENLDAIEFLRELNVMVHEHFPGALTIAEESTAWPMVSRPTYVGGLGFSMKWNMGWMNDTLAYMRLDPIYRRFHHGMLTFGHVYAYTENFVLPFSHDEVVHGKGSLLAKMPGDAWQQFASLRLLFTYQMTWPGKKLNFMGNEFGQGREWSATHALDWGLLQTAWHEGVQKAVRDLNRLYRELPQLHELDFAPEGFAWIDCHDADQSILAYQRRDRAGRIVLVVLNFTPVPRQGYRIGCPAAGLWREIFNSDSEWYGGSNVGNGAGLLAEEVAWMGHAYSLVLTVPPLAGILLMSE